MHKCLDWYCMRVWVNLDFSLGLVSVTAFLYWIFTAEVQRGGLNAWRISVLQVCVLVCLLIEFVPMGVNLDILERDLSNWLFFIFSPQVFLLLIEASRHGGRDWSKFSIGLHWISDFPWSEQVYVLASFFFFPPADRKVVVVLKRFMPFYVYMLWADFLTVLLCFFWTKIL